MGWAGIKERAVEKKKQRLFKRRGEANFKSAAFARSLPLREREIENGQSILHPPSGEGRPCRLAEEGFQERPEQGRRRRMDRGPLERLER